MKKKDQDMLPSDQDVDKYDLLNQMFNAIFIEMKQLSKSKQEMELNQFKVKKINEILIKIKDLLSKQPTNEFLDLLDDETLPRYSDSILILAQYRTALDQFHDKYFLQEGEGFFTKHRWHTKESP